jgi:tetratricopeptide (TPR) repeat protein
LTEFIKCGTKLAEASVGNVIVKTEYLLVTIACLAAAVFLLAIPFSSPPVLAQRTTTLSPSARAETLLREGKGAEALSILLKIHRSQPKNFKVCHQVGLAYTQMQQFEKAAEFYRKALRLFPSFIPSRKNLGTVLWFSNHKEEAEHEFLAVTKALPKDPVPHLYLGSLQFERKQFSQAKAHFKQAGDLAFNNPEALPMVLETYLASQDLSFPDRMMQQLQQAETPNPELVFQCGVLFGRYGFYSRAILAFEKVKTNYPDRYALSLNLGTAQLQARQFRAAIESLEGLVASNSAKGEVFLLLGEAYDREGNPEKAYSAYTRAIEMEPQSEEGYIALSSFASAHHNDEFALKTLARGLERIPGSTKLLVQQGTIWALAMDLPQAEDSFRKASQSDPQAGLPLLALGLSQMQANKLAEATATLRQAASKAPDDFRPEYFYALTLVRAGGRGDPVRRKEIIASLERAIALNPQDPESRVALGQTYQSADQLDLATKELEKALELDPSNATALYQLGLIYRKQGKVEAAQRLLNSFEKVKAKAKQEEDQERKALVQIMKTVSEK